MVKEIVIKGLFWIIRRLYLIFGILLLLAFCEAEENDMSTAPYAETETWIRSKYDSMASFTWDQYIELLTLLSEKKYVVLPLNKMRTYHNKSVVVVGIRHDVDLNPFKALEMAKIEKQFGFSATYFILATSEYYGKITSSGIERNPGMGQLYREIYDTGAEIGVHNDLISAMVLYGKDPFEFNSEELKFYKSLGIPIYGTASHGGPINKQTAINYEIFSDFTKKDTITYNGKKYPVGQLSLKAYRYKYEAYHIEYNKYFSESGGNWNDPAGFKGVLEKIQSSQPGDRIQILTHPERWGKAVKNSKPLTQG
jgi:hypothetical protein